MKRFVDPDFRAHTTVAQLVAELLLRFSSYRKLPLRTAAFSDMLTESIMHLQALISGHVTPNAEKQLGARIYLLFE